jgi:hypothetical protein
MALFGALILCYGLQRLYQTWKQRRRIPGRGQVDRDDAQGKTGSRDA